MDSRKRPFKASKSTRTSNQRYRNLAESHLLDIAKPNGAAPSYDVVTTHPKLYAYTPLESSKHIRILRLEPSSDRSAPLRFSFQVGTLKELLHQYEAISYTWGGELDFTHQLHSVEGNATISITHNLDSALRRFRNELHPRDLWADAVCINQSDDAEKTIQIPIMRDVYQAASRVLVWLGGGADEEDAIQILFAVSRGVSFIMTEHEELPESELEAALNVIVSRPYFKRRWIIQELASNLDVTLFCGEHEMTWIRFMAAIKHTQSFFAEDIFYLASLKPIYTLISLWRFRAQGDSDYAKRTPEFDLSILELMDRFENFNYSHPLDRLYALYSLASNVLEMPASLAIPAQWNSMARSSCGKEKDGLRSIPMVMDYSLPCESIFHMFAASAMASGFCLDILASAALRKPSSTLTLPSWVPDWTSKMQPKPHERLRGNLDSLYFASHKYARITFAGYSFAGKGLPKVATLFSQATHTDIENHPRGQGVEPSIWPLNIQGPHGNPIFAKLHWPKSLANRDAFQQMLNEMGFTGTDWSVLQRLMNERIRAMITVEPLWTLNASLAAFQDDGSEEFRNFFQTYSLFSTEINISSNLNSGTIVAFIGIANAPVQIQDQFMVPQAYNLGYSQSPGPAYLRALVLRPIRHCFNLVGFAYLIPVYASVRKVGELWRDGNDNYEGNLLRDFNFSLHLFEIDLK